MTSIQNHLKSWLITFVGLFIPLMIPALSGLSLTQAGAMAFGLALCRSVIKVLGEMTGAITTT